jgi:hypothetical protein
MSNAAGLPPFQPVLQSEVPAEWRQVDPRQLEEARVSMGLPAGTSMEAVTVIELPDLPPFWAYTNWKKGRGRADEVAVMVVANDVFRGGGQQAESAKRESLRSLLYTGRPALHWIRVFVPAGSGPQ